MLSIKGILKFKPGVNILRYFPKTVITAIVPCFTVTNDENSITKKIKNKTKNTVPPGVMAYGFMIINVAINYWCAICFYKNTKTINLMNLKRTFGAILRLIVLVFL